MKTLVALIVASCFLILTPDISDARDRDRHDRHYQKDRDHYSYQHARGYDQGKRHDGYWKKQYRHKKHDKYWKKHRRYRHDTYRHVPGRVVYRPAPVRVIERPVVYYPESYFTVGVPNLRFHFSW